MEENNCKPLAANVSGLPVTMAKYAGRSIGSMTFDWPLYFDQQIFRIR
jgi:hypothetical protein